VVENGYEVHGEHFSTEFVSGGVFSLDGIHPSSLGYGILTNRIIERMNEGWGTNIAPVDLASIYGVTPGLGQPVDPRKLPDFGTLLDLFR
jgi:hypothetical protein